MHGSLWSIAAFDFTRRFRSMSMWVYFILYAVLSALWMAMAGGAFAQVSVNFGGDKVLINGPYTLMLGMAVMGFMGVTMIGSICGRAVQQDYEAGIHHFFFSAPISKFDYFAGRLLGAYLTLLVVFLGIVLGIQIGVHWPGVDASRVLASPSVQSFARPYLFMLVPNLLWQGGCFFVLAALTRQMAPVYVAGVVVLIGYLFAINLLSDMDNKFLSALIDPSGATAVDVLTRYWSVAEKNGTEIPFGGVLLWNRVLWFSVGAVATVLGYAAFRMEAVSPSGRASRKAVATEVDADTDRHVTMPVAIPTRTSGAYLRMLPGLAQLYLREILRSPRFLTIVLGGVLLVVGFSFTLGSNYGTNTYPLTYKVLDVVSGLFSTFVLVVTAIYTGELVWRERDARMDDITDSMPAPTWLAFGAKFATVLVVQGVLLLVILVCGIGVQLARGYTRIELGHYLFELFVLQWSGYALIAVLALVVHTFLNNKYLGHFLVGIFFLVLINLPNFGFEDKLYLYASRPELIYSDMNGYGHGLAAYFWFRAYWYAFAVLLVLASYGVWVRGRDRGFGARLKGAGARLRSPFARTVAVVGVLAFVAVGGFIYWNTHVLNPFTSRYVLQGRQADYERKYRSFAGAPQPRITGVEMQVDLFPERHTVRLVGKVTLVNKTEQPIKDVYVLYSPRARVASMRFSTGARLADEDPNLFWHHYALDTPLAPRATTTFDYDMEYGARGFMNDGPDRVVLTNGTFLNAGESALALVVPSFGYAEDGELKSDRDRKRFDLPAKERMHDLDDKVEVNATALSRDADFIDYAARVCTSGDQLPVTSGYVERDWTETGPDGPRRCIAYRMDSPMANIYPFVSARYAQKTDTWHGPNGDVAIEIDYHRGHEYNLDRMVAGVKDSLDYFGKSFGPYQHKIARIIEFPRFGRNGGFAESFPNTVPFNEALGFTAKVDDKDPDDVDYPYFVTAHEMAHQWWAHQEMPANVQGAEFVTESLAEYSALMVLKHKYGDVRMRRFLKYELDRYLQGRGTEQKREQPLVRADGAAYVHYQKGALVLYALQDLIGEAAMNDALSSFLRQWHFKGPPYARSVDLLRELTRVTPPEHRDVIHDLFEVITLYDLRALDATAKPGKDGTTDVTIRVTAKQVRADGGGNEVEVPISLPIDIGVLDAKGNVLAIERHAMKPGESTFTLSVKGDVARAGIDPLAKLIDRDTSDNVVAVGK